MKGKVIVVTGAAGALGQAMCHVAQNKQAIVIGLDVVKADSLANTDHYHTVNLLAINEIQAVLNNIDRIDALVNVAGGFSMGEDAFDLESPHWQRMFDLNVNTMRNATAVVIPKMLAQEKGAIINIGALGALKGEGTMSAYCASKSVVMRMTESLSEEVKEKGINVNAVLPSIIDTQANREAMPTANFAQWVTPEKLAEVIYFLTTDQASAIHGALLPVKGLS